MSTLRLPSGSEIPLDSGSPETLEDSIRQFMNPRTTNLDTLAAALLKQVGPSSMADYELVEDWTEKGKIRWYYRKRK